MILCVAVSARRDPERSHFVWSPEQLATGQRLSGNG